MSTTVSGNYVLKVGGYGGGIYNDGTLTLISSTVCSNEAVSSYSNWETKGGGVYNSGTVVSKNSIFAGNSAVAGSDFYGTLNSQGFNFIQDANGCTIVGDTTGNLLGVDPLLGPLQDNGGPTWTHALLPGSPAIDQGNSAGLSTDQRGAPRPYDAPIIPNAGDGSDIGAYEWTPAPLVAIPDTVTRVPGLSLKIMVADLLANDSSETVKTFTGVSATSTNAVTLTTDGNLIFYTNSPNVNDQFTYTITDGSLTATGLVRIIMTPLAGGQATTAVIAGDTATVGFAGIPGFGYEVQRTTSLVSPTWHVVLTTNAPPAGVFQVVDDFIDLGGPPAAAYYRLRWVP